MPVSESISWMSSSRHGAPFSWYSDSPVRNSSRVMVTSENSIGSIPDVLSIVSETSARPRAGRSDVPAKMTSSIFVPRSERAPCAPSTHATASTRFDFPEPFGPTTTVTPGSKSSTVLSAKDLNPRRVSDFRNTQILVVGVARRWRVGQRGAGTVGPAPGVSSVAIGRPRERDRAPGRRATARHLPDVPGRRRRLDPVRPGVRGRDRRQPPLATERTWSWPEPNEPHGG